MNSTVQPMNSLVPILNSRPAASASFTTTGWSSPLLWFVGFLLVFLALFSVYYRQFMSAIQNWSDSLNLWLKGHTPMQTPPVPEPQEIQKAPTGVDALVEKILPPAKDVFTVSKNDYTYYDAAPLCKALGAELATYDQVKQAWNKGADWCNYGWVKGQMAVYPTQNSTYEELQQGPAEQRGACGKPGLNGGYFDNPELKFGVTCVGKRPAQRDHDVMKEPLTASGLEFEKKVQHFKEGSDTIGLLPFNKERWM